MEKTCNSAYCIPLDPYPVGSQRAPNKWAVMRANSQQRERPGDTIGGMFGSAARAADRLEIIRSQWTFPEKEPASVPQDDVSFRLALRSFVRGLSNLLLILPARKRREVQMPETTWEQDIAESWRDVGRALGDATRNYDSSAKHKSCG